MEKRNSQLEHGQPMEQTRGLFRTYDSGVARYQSQHQYHFWQKGSMFDGIAQASELGSCQFRSFHPGIMWKMTYMDLTD